MIVSLDAPGSVTLGLAESFHALSIAVPESLASRNAEIGALDEAEIPLLEEQKQLSVSFGGDALRQ